MDTKTLTAGQRVRMRSGKYTQQGKVVAVVSSPPGTVENGLNGPLPIPEWYVEVEMADGITFIRFDSNGKTGSAWDGLGSWDSRFGGLQDPRTPCTEFGPWELTDAL